MVIKNVTKCNSRQWHIGSDSGMFLYLCVITPFIDGTNIKKIINKRIKQGIRANNKRLAVLILIFFISGKLNVTRRPSFSIN